MRDQLSQHSGHAAPLGVVLFDGDCLMCSSSVRRMIAMDRRGVLQFAPLRGAAAGRLLGELGVDPSELPDSMVLISGGKASVRSDAIIGIARLLGRPYAAASILRVVPRFIRDGVYSLIASNRHRLSKLIGNKDACTIMPPEIAHRFLQS